MATQELLWQECSLLHAPFHWPLVGTVFMNNMMKGFPTLGTAPRNSKHQKFKSCGYIWSWEMIFSFFVSMMLGPLITKIVPHHWDHIEVIWL